MAGKLKPGQVFHLLCIFSVVFFLFIFSGNVSGDVDYQRVVPPEDKTTAVWLSSIRQSGNSFWGKLRETLSGVQSHLFPPNLDFRGKDDASMGAGDNVKEAVAKSFEKSKDTVDEAAMTAAEFVGVATETVKEKVKNSVSRRETHQPSEDTDEL